MNGYLRGTLIQGFYGDQQGTKLLFHRGEALVSHIFFSEKELYSFLRRNRISIQILHLHNERLTKN